MLNKSLLVLVVIANIILLVIWLVFRQKQYSFKVKSERKNVYESKSVIEIPRAKDKSFMFDVTVVDPETFISRQLKAKILLTDVELFMNPIPTNSVSTQRSFVSPPNEDLIREHVKLQFLRMQEDALEFDVDSKDELSEHYYEIRNRYFLMDPFLTSGKDMLITNNMKNKFQNVLQLKGQEQFTASKSFNNQHPAS